MWIEEQSLDPGDKYDDYDYLRFCRARKFVLEDVKLMFRTSMEWRKKNSADTILEDMQDRFSNIGDLKLYFGHGYHGIDK